MKLQASIVEPYSSTLLLEYCQGGELFDVLENTPEFRFTESFVQRYFRQILNGLSEIHSRGIVHLDLKPENILCSKDLNTLKITDFGMSMCCDAGEKTLPGTLQGTVDYMAPEQINYDEVGHKTDIWAAGIIIFLQ